MSKKINTGRGPSYGVVDNIHRILLTLIEMLHTRIELAILEFGEEKSRIGSIFMLIGVTLIFTVFGIISLLIFILLSASPENRMIVLGGASAGFNFLALSSAILVKKMVSRSRMFPETRRQLGEDLSLLKRNRP